MRLILITTFILTTLYNIAGELDSTQFMMMNKSKFNTQQINLYLHSNNRELSSNGLLSAVSGLGFITTGILLESRRIRLNIPDGHNGYIKSKEIGFNYLITSIGAGLTITGVIMIRKSYK